MDAIEIFKLEPGPETDALVAKALGVELNNGVWKRPDEMKDMFDPSTNIESAWHVQEKMFERGYYIRLGRGSCQEHTGSPIKTCFTCEMIHVVTKIGCSTKADTAQMAICQAVLLLQGA